jgi:glycerophosphoryl diester phosphodiesterase
VVPIQIVAHRGASGMAPENSQAALRSACEVGAPWAELDVQRTSDGVAVLVHDDTWERTAGKNLQVRQTSWETVRTLDVGAWFSTAFAEEAVPRLEDILAWTQRISLNLEIKSPENDPGLALCVAQMVRQAGAQQRTLLSSFDANCIEELAGRYADLRLGYLGHAARRDMHRGVRLQILEAVAILGDPSCVAAVREQGGAVWAWTVDDPVIADQLVALGVEALITNQPQRLLAHFA